MCFVTTTQPTAGVKWAQEAVSEYVKGYTHDVKQVWIRQAAYDRVVKRLLSCTGWAALEVWGWLAGSRFKA